MSPERKNPRTVVFGGSGFLGTALIERLAALGQTANLVAVARNEGGLVALRERFPWVEILVGDIADRWIVKKAMASAEEVYLLSALKHVGLAELEVMSAISTNIAGAAQVVEESIFTRPRVLVFISTDKAAQPSGVYGCTKKLIERLLVEASGVNPATRYRVIRYGNVWASTGSIATKWEPKMRSGQEVVITDRAASRFFWTVAEAVDLILGAEAAPNAEPIVPEMKAIKMGVVLDACMDVWGHVPVREIGLQPGENRVETCDGVHFSDSVAQFTKAEFIEKFLK